MKACTVKKTVLVHYSLPHPVYRTSEFFQLLADNIVEKKIKTWYLRNVFIFQKLIVFLKRCFKINFMDQK
jgi:hypothetical protein